MAAFVSVPCSAVSSARSTMASLLFPIEVVSGAAGDFLTGNICPYHEQPRRRCRLAGLPCVHILAEDTRSPLAWPSRRAVELVRQVIGATLTVHYRSLGYRFK